MSEAVNPKAYPLADAQVRACHLRTGGSHTFMVSNIPNDVLFSNIHYFLTCS